MDGLFSSGCAMLREKVSLTLGYFSAANALPRANYIVGYTKYYPYCLATTNLHLAAHEQRICLQCTPQVTSPSLGQVAVSLLAFVSRIFSQ